MLSGAYSLINGAALVPIPGENNVQHERSDRG